MEIFSWILIMSLTCHFSRGTFIQTSGSVDHSDFITFRRSAGRRSPDLAQGSGLGVVSTASQHHINLARTSEEAERVRTRPESGIAFSWALEPSRHRGADRASNGSVLSRVGVVDLTGGSRVTAAEQFTEPQRPREKDGGHTPKRFIQTKVVLNKDLQRPEGPCGQGLLGCVFLKNLTGTNLLWDDMSRTLAFAWELHVFGCAALFILMGALAALAMAGACTLPRPLCDALALANSFLLAGGAARGLLLLLDPYGSQQVLSRAQVAALHNVPLLLLLWTHVALTLLALRLDPLLFHGPLQRPPVVGVLGLSHCTLLLILDLRSCSLSPALQTLSLCWSLLFCGGTLAGSLSKQRPWFRLLEPRRTERAERWAGRVAVCALLGVLCCSLQVHSLLWIYGFLGNWRRFGWGWWFTQFWARVLELAWGFFLLVLGSWIFWAPYKGHLRADRWSTKGPERKSQWSRVLSRVQTGHWRESERGWEELMPSTWGKYDLSRANLSHSPLSPYHDPPSDLRTEVLSSGGSNPPAATLLWQKVGEHECILSLIEFNLRPPSPVDLQRSIDEALHQGQLISGGLFSRPSSWSHAHHPAGSALTFPPSCMGYSWMLDSDSSSMSLDRFQAREQTLSPGGTPEYCSSLGSSVDLGSLLVAVTHRHQWAEDVTDL